MFDYILKQISIQRLKYRNTRIKFLHFFFGVHPTLQCGKQSVQVVFFDQEVTDQRCSIKLSEVQAVKL